MNKRIIKRFFTVGLGAILGYVYYYFIGCYNGTCPISRNPYVSIIYGALIGLIWSISNKKNEQPKNN